MARAAGVEIREGVEVTAIDGRSLLTTSGAIECEVVVLAPGPWARDLLALLGPDTVSPAGSVATWWRFARRAAASAGP